MKKKLLALTLAALMVMSLAACGGSKEEPAAETPAETEQTETQEPAA